MKTYSPPFSSSYSIHSPAGVILYEYLTQSGVYLPDSCGGKGTCGKCRVQILSGVTSPITIQEEKAINPHERSQGIRLACQTRLVKEGTILLNDFFLPHHEKSRVSSSRRNESAHNTFPCSIAVDIGTTTITACLVEHGTNHIRKSVSTTNPQIVYGPDVVSRLKYAGNGGGEKLQAAVKNALIFLITTLLPASRQVAKIVIAGNTCMHHLFLRLPVQSLTQYPYRPILKEPILTTTHAFGLKDIPDVSLYLLPLVGGFIGSDHVAMILASGISETRETVLGIDMGTNTEIVLAHQGSLMSTSCASGPVFEAAHITYGMRATPGAIDKARFRGTHLVVHTLGGIAPKGLCGSGVLQVTSRLVESGILDSRGHLKECPQVSGYGCDRSFLLVPPHRSFHGYPIALLQKDIVQLQLAKAAIRTGIETLLIETDLKWRDIDRVVLTGGFATPSIITALRTLAILPPIQFDRVHIVKEAALRGCCMVATSPLHQKRAQNLAPLITTVELATHPYYKTHYPRYLLFSQEDGGG